MPFQRKYCLAEWRSFQWAENCLNPKAWRALTNGLHPTGNQQGGVNSGAFIDGYLTSDLGKDTDYTLTSWHLMRIRWHTKRQSFCQEDLAQPEPWAIRHFVKFNRNGKVSTWRTKIPQAGMDGQAAATLPKSSKCLQQVPGCKGDFPPHRRKSECTALAEGWAACHPPHLRDGEISQDVCKS